MSTFAKKVTSAVAGLAIVFSIVSPIAGVSAAYSSLDAANKLATLGVIVDQSANPSAYRLADTTSREELSKVISNLGGLVVTEGENSVYADTNFADWSEKYARALNAAGYAASNEFFNPKNNATKIEALKWVMEARNIATSAMGDNWMEQRVNGAVDAGIASTFTDYNADASRGQVFIWASEAIDAGDDLTIDDNLLCSILGTCGDVVDGGDTDNGGTNAPTTGGTSIVSKSPLSPTSGFVAAEKNRTTILAFDVTAGASDVELDELVLKYVGLSNALDIENISIYKVNNEVSTSGRTFDSDKEAEISFENDVVVQAGETDTFIITAFVKGGEDNVSHQVEIIDLITTSGNVVLDGTIKSMVFNVIVATNTATLDFDYDDQNSDADLGDTVILADFSLEEQDEENTILKSLTFEIGGGVDAEDDIEDIVLYADGVEIASNLRVNNDDEIVIDLDFMIGQDESVDFTLEAVITGSVGDELIVDITDIYAIGESSGIIASIDNGGNVFDNEIVATFDINGAQFNISFDKSDIDEAKPGAEDVLVGTLEILADSDYIINELQILVENPATATTVENMILNLEVDGDSYTDIDISNPLKVIYTFSDLDVDAGVDTFFDVMFEIVDKTNLNTESLEFTVTLLEIEDNDADETYNAGSDPTLNDVTSSTTFSVKTIDIESASYELVQTKLSDRALVLGNGIEVVLYQGKVSIGDAASVVFNDITFLGTINGIIGGTGYDVEDIIQAATINIGGITEDADVRSDRLDFNNIDIEVAAGSDNVEVLVTALLKDSDAVALGDTVSFTTSDLRIDAEDTDNDDVVNESVINTLVPTTLVLNDKGSFTVRIVTNGDFEDDIEEVVLAGTNNVILAEVEIEAEEENVDVNEMVFVVEGQDSGTTISSVRLMNGATVLDTGVVTYDGSDTFITFEDFTVEDTGNIINVTVEADLEIITDEGGAATAIADDIIVTLISANIDADGESSNEQLVVAGGNTSALAVSVVPVLLTISVIDELGTDEDTAIIQFNLDVGNNQLDDDDVVINSIALADAVAGGVIVRNDDNIDVSIVDSTLATLSLVSNSEVRDGDRFELIVSTEGDELRILVNGIVYTVNGDAFASRNDKVIDLDTFTDSTN